MEFVALNSSRLSARDMAFQVAAVSAQLTNEFARAWAAPQWAAVGLDFRITDNDLPWPMNEYTTIQGLPLGSYFEVDIVDEVPPGELGDHDPLSARVKPNLDDPFDATVLSHEALEARGDITCAAMIPGVDRMWAAEACDPCERDFYRLPTKLFGEVRWVNVSNFILPAWFVPLAPPPYDYMGLIKNPFELRPGSYALFEQNGKIDAVYADGAAREKVAAKLAAKHSRTARRFAHGDSSSGGRR